MSLTHNRLDSVLGIREDERLPGRNGGLKDLTVGDLFCGAGGFSEGFRQAGFEISWAVDNWPPAVTTFKKNFPKTRVLSCDIAKLSSGDLEPVDVVIGSPPCTHFSMANRGGNGDKRMGFRLVRRFFELIVDLNPKYWIMENVPPLASALEQRLDGDSIRLTNGTLPVPVRQVLTASKYGTPQSRKRLFSGKYPMPVESRRGQPNKAATLRDLLKAMPDPCRGLPSAETTYVDPLYPAIVGTTGSLRDHFEDAKFRLSEQDLDDCQRQKQKHYYGGPMDWPDRLDRPSRTITATRTTASRSTIVVDCPHHSNAEGQYRGLTLRECASIQGFPTTYQFWAESTSTKDALVGNAVAPPVAKALAQAILRTKGRRILRVPRINQKSELPPILNASRRKNHRYSEARHFRGIVPIQWRPKWRVEMENFVSKDTPTEGRATNLSTRWMARLYLGYAKEYRCYDVRRTAAVKIAVRTASWKGDLGLREPFSALLHQAEAEFERLPDADSLQRRWAGRAEVGVSPIDILSSVQGLVEANFPTKVWAGVWIPKQLLAPTLTPLLVKGGKEANANPPIDVPVQTLAALVALSLAVDAINSGPPMAESG